MRRCYFCRCLEKRNEELISLRGLLHDSPSNSKAESATKVAHETVDGQLHGMTTCIATDITHFLNEVITAISRLSTPAWTAMREL